MLTTRDIVVINEDIRRGMGIEVNDLKYTEGKRIWSCQKSGG